MRCIAFVMLLFGLVGCQSEKKPQISAKILGRWDALSRNHMSISGNMQIAQNQLKFEKHGVVPFQILKSSPTECLLMIHREVDDGLIMRMALRDDEHGDLEVAYYESLEKANESTSDMCLSATSWGIYVR